MEEKNFIESSPNKLLAIAKRIKARKEENLRELALKSQQLSTK